MVLGRIELSRADNEIWGGMQDGDPTGPQDMERQRVGKSESAFRVDKARSRSG